MGLVTVERAQPGMVLTAPVTDKRGRKLIPADVALTERHLQALKMWGIPQIEVEQDDAEEAAPLALTPEEEERVKGIIDARFGDADRAHPFIAALYECAVRQAVHGTNVVGGDA